MQFKIQSVWWDRTRVLNIYPTHIEYERSNRRNAALWRIEKSDVSEFRFGLEWITGYAFTFGRTYIIDIKTEQEEILKIRLTSFYRIGVHAKDNLYNAILDDLNDNYFDNLTRAYLTKFENEEQFTLVGITFEQNGITLTSKDLILWEDVMTRSYETYFAIFSSRNKTINQLSYYLHDWNVGILYSVMRAILKWWNQPD